MNRPLPVMLYLLDSSSVALGEFWRRQLGDAANLRKDVRNVLSAWVEALAMALLAEWFSKYGEALVLIAGAEPAEREALLRALLMPAPEEAPKQVKCTEAELAAILRPPRHRQRHPGGFRKLAKA